MPTITISKKALENLAGKKLPLEKLKERISYLGTDLEGISEKEITAEIFPNRPDMLSAPGFARAFSSFIGVKTGLRKYSIKPSGHQVIIDSSVKNVRPYTACAIVKGLKFDDEKIREVIDIQEKLHVTYGRNRKKAAIGIYPFEKIRPPIRFTAKNPAEIMFKPLDSQREMTGQQILTQHPTGREYAHLLEGQSLFPVFIDSNDKILSMPPIINSEETGKITQKTSDVFIECSGFDFEVLHKCINMIAAALADMGGQICSMKLKYEDKTRVTPDLEPEKMRLDLEYVNKKLGLELKEADAKKLLEKMGYGHEKNNVLIPAYRVDVLHQSDLAEDIAIAYGFENFEAVNPHISTTAEEDKLEVLKRKICELMTGQGFLEVNTFNVTNKKMQTEKMNADKSVVELLNSVSKEHDALRAWMLPSIMEVLAANKHRAYPQKIFGTGNIFEKNPEKETNIEEREHLSAAISNETADYTEIKQLADYVMKALGIEAKTEEAENKTFIQGRAAKITTKNREIAVLGEISPEVLFNWGLAMPTTAIEINLNELFEAVNE